MHLCTHQPTRALSWLLLDRIYDWNTSDNWIQKADYTVLSILIYSVLDPVSLTLQFLLLTPVERRVRKRSGCQTHNGKGEITPFPLDLAPNSNPPSSPPLVPAPAPASAATAAPLTVRSPSFSLPAPVQRFLDFGSCPLVREREMSPPSRSRSLTAPSSPAEQAPILKLKLSGPSFLDTVIRDTACKEPLYIIQTVHDLTQIYRLDSRLREAGKAATVQWPRNVTMTDKGKGRSGKSVQMGSGSWRDAEEFLKVGALGNLASRKFNLPHFPHSVKWKLIPGNCYVCTTTGIKGPIAVFDAATLSAPPRLRIYQTLIAPDLARSQQNHSGVPFLLLDYLVATALLLTTTTQEWLDRPADAHLPGSSSRIVKKWLSVINPSSFPPPAAEGNESITGETESSSSSATPFPSTTNSSTWDSHTSWSSSSGSGGSENAVMPLTPATTPSAQSSAFSLSRSRKGIQGLRLPTPSEVSQESDPPPPATVPQPPPPPQIRFEVANPESSPDYFASMSMAPSRSYYPSPPSSSPPYTPPSTLSHPFAYGASPRPSSSSSVSSAMRRPRQLPTPPILQDSQASPSQSQAQVHALARVISSPSTIPASAQPVLHESASYARLAAWSAASNSQAMASGSRAPVRQSMRSIHSIPPAPPPPQHVSLPLPPKLALEYGRGEGPSLDQGAPANTAVVDHEGLVNGMATLTQSSLPPPPPPPHFLYFHSRAMTDAGTVHFDAGRVRASFAHVDPAAEADSVYEMPPPAYDAIDFSLGARGPGRGRERRS